MTRRRPMSTKARPDADNGQPERRTRADDKFDRYAWRDAVFADPKTPTNAKCLAFGIAKHVNGETGEAVVSTPKLAKVCGRSATWVRDTIPVLHNIGWVVIEIGSKGRGEDHCNVYRINPEKRTPSALLKRPENRRRGAILERAGKSNLLRLKSHFLRQKAHPVCEEPHNPSNPKKERGSAARTSRAVRESASNSTSDDATVPAPDRPVPRAPQGAQITGSIIATTTFTQRSRYGASRRERARCTRRQPVRAGFERLPGRSRRRRSQSIFRVRSRLGCRS